MANLSSSCGELTAGVLPTSIAAGAVPVAAATRGDVVESVHCGHVALFDASSDDVVGVGDPQVELFGRSTAKPLQALAMVKLGLVLPPHLLALVCASHSAESIHRDAVVQILEMVGLTPAALQATPAVPLGETSGKEWLAAGRGPDAIAHDCSGKHAGMLVTCVVNGWSIDNYLDPIHPLQVAIREELELVFGMGGPSSVDGCGAPLYGHSLVGLARAYRALGVAEPGSMEHQVANAMRVAPHMVGGSGRPVTEMMYAVPGLIAKDGAEAVLAFADDSGNAAAVKILDGGARPLPVVAGAILRRWGLLTDQLAQRLEQPVLGHGKPVGAIEPIAELFAGS